MKKYVRTCISLDKDTIDKLTDTAKILNITKSGTIKEAIKFLYNHVISWKKEEKECFTK